MEPSQFSFDPIASLYATAPKQQLLKNSVSVTNAENLFTDWTKQDHADSYQFMQKIARCWEAMKTRDQYLIYGKVNQGLFNWEMVPYARCRTIFGRVYQQLQVLWRTVFGGIQVSSKERTAQIDEHNSNLSKYKIEVNPSDAENLSDDNFCKEEVIDRQWVVTGQKVNVLFNYAPIGFGGEKLHFLVVPRQHREKFTDVTEEEYCESLDLTTKMINHFAEHRDFSTNVYLMHKTGKDAGQTVKHWHLQVIFSTNPSQDFWGKLTVLKNIFWGSSPMKPDALAKRVTELRTELAAIKV